MVEVLYWNQAKSRTAAQEAIESRQEYDILAIQEPWVNKQTKQPYHPQSSRYHLVWGTGCAAIYINKRTAPSDWTEEAGEDWAAIRLRQGAEWMTIYSAYSPCNDEPNWTSPLQRVATESPINRDIIVGDINLHHPLWDWENRTLLYVGRLLTLADRWDLRLLTPWGKPTRRRGNNRDSTIDHAWVTNGVEAQCLGPADLTGSDHIPQLVRIGGPPSASHQPGEVRLGYSWSLMDRHRVAPEA